MSSPSLSLSLFYSMVDLHILSGTVLLPNFDRSILCLSFCQCFPVAHDQRTFCTCIFKESAARSQIGGAIFLERSYHVHFNVHSPPPHPVLFLLANILYYLATEDQLPETICKVSCNVRCFVNNGKYGVKN